MRRGPFTEDGIKHRALASFAWWVVATVGCAGANTVASPDLSDDFGSLNGATLELSSAGGIAGLQVHQLIRHDERTYVSTTRRICSPACGAPIDSISGILSAAADDSLFNIAWEQTPFSLNGDYGHTLGGADMVSYALTVSFNGRTKTIAADDGTMPPQMRTIITSMRGMITASAGR
jgi:hypothetical protein